MADGFSAGQVYEGGVEMRHKREIVGRVGVAADREGNVLLNMFSEDTPYGRQIVLTKAAASVLLYKLVVAGIRHPWVRESHTEVKSAKTHNCKRAENEL